MMNTKKALTIILTMALVLGVYGVAHADNTATQTVRFEVTAINAISVIGNPATLTINTATAGAMPDPATDSSTTYAVTTNGTTKKITAKIDSDMPTDLDLKVFLKAPTDASGGGGSLTTAELDVVTGIGPVVASGLTILYELRPNTMPAPTSGTKTVTFTLTDQ